MKRNLAKFLSSIIFGFVVMFTLGIIALHSLPDITTSPDLTNKSGVSDKREEVRVEDLKKDEKKVDYKLPGNYAKINNPYHAYQTFNNCGPATLSMILGYLGNPVNQTELGRLMRPHQNQSGDNDDKTIFSSEFVYWANEYGFESVSRVNGDIELLKKFTTNGFPVVVKTWLGVDDEIGHFRVVTGFDEARQVILQDDSYQGKNLSIPYDDFLTMWQPFNYNYIITFTSDQADLVEAIIGDEIDVLTNWTNALARAESENLEDPINVYPYFNISSSHYHLGNYEESVRAYEEVESRLPFRMLWYQIEPILAYRELRDYDRVFDLTQKILDNDNRAYSELYQLRGEIYEKQGATSSANEEFRKAKLYNTDIDKIWEGIRS